MAPITGYSNDVRDEISNWFNKLAFLVLSAKGSELK